MIIIVDYGMGNLGSVLNMLKKTGADAKISSSVDDIHKAEKLILPGVGSFDNGMNNLVERGLYSVIEKKVIGDKTPILGVCLGMQLLTKRSEEGKVKGFGWIDAETIKFNLPELKVPHMSWNSVHLRRQSNIFKDMPERMRFYFVHSYYVSCAEISDVVATTRYGIEFTSIIQRDNIWGMQFHPEKSHKYGLALLKNFVETV